MAIRSLISFALIAGCAGVAIAGCKHADSTRAAPTDPGPAAAVPLAAEPTAVELGAAPPPRPELPKSVDPKDLDDKERKVLLDVLAEQFDPCGKTRSMLDALRAGDCAIAPKLAARLVEFLGPQGMGKAQAVQALLREIERLNTVVPIDIGTSPVRGPADAKVKIVEFSDFECPFCRRAIVPLEKLRAHYQALLCYKFYPLKLSHPNAEGAARAAWAAHQQGKFWEMHDTLFANQDKLDWPAVQSYAKKLGLDGKKFAADVQSEASKAAVAADEKAGEVAGVDGTPTFYVNGRRAESLGQVQELVREALQASGQAVPEPLGAAEFAELETGAAAAESPATVPARAAPAAEPAK
ncbi:MAG: thioredoxin domain-containing protein [Deltaproteobacteria bacterium]|nr:thioredoxin domain-containing protein [Deltaproteobacteria bacterium]